MKWLKNIFVFTVINLLTAQAAFADEVQTQSFISRIRSLFEKKISFEVDGEPLNMGIFRTNNLGATKLGGVIEKTITVTNITDRQLKLSPLTISGSSSFSIKTNIAAGTFLDPGQKTAVVVQARPMSGFKHAATLSMPASLKMMGSRLLKTNAVALSIQVTPAPKLGIYDNGYLVVAGSSLSLGNLEVGVPVQKTLTYKNDGSGVLDITSAFVFSKQFHFIQIPQGSLAEGASDELIIEFTPTEGGTVNVPMLVGSIDPTDAQYRINFTGEVSGGATASKLKVYDMSDDVLIAHNPSRDSDFVYVGGANAGSNKFTKVFRLLNGGDSSLRINDIANFFPAATLALANASAKISTRALKSARLARQGGVGVAVGGFPLNLGVGKHIDITLDFSPTSNSIHTGYVEIHTDDQSAPDYQFNVAAAVAGPHGLLCAGDNNNWVPADFTCAGKSNGTICGANSEEKTKVCNQGQCVLMGDLNSDGFVDVSDLGEFIKQMKDIEAPVLAADTRCTGNLTTVTYEQVQDFASLLVDSENNRNYNTRVIESCSNRDLSNDPTRGRALVFANGPINFQAMKDSTADGIITKDTPIIYNDQTEVCIDNLGIYDLDGNYGGSNRGTINGKYTYTGTVVFNSSSEGLPPFGQFVDLANDFRFSVYGDDGRNSPREAVMRSTAVQLYHDISDLRSVGVNDRFINDLKLDDLKIKSNLLERQGRDDLIMKDAHVPSRPVSLAIENFEGSGIKLFPEVNQMKVDTRTRAKGVSFDYSDSALASAGFDPGFAAADFAGLMFFWITQNKDWRSYTEFFFGDTPAWKTNIIPAINDGLSAWTAYRITGQTEVYKQADFMARKASVTGGCIDGILPCDKGQEIKNVMMFDSLATSLDQTRTVFPFRTPPNFFNGDMQYDGPVGSDLSALFFGALFYDLSVEAGLGDRNADLIFWKAVSMIDNPTQLSMNEFGLKIVEAARLIFPDVSVPSKSIYDREIRETLISRGITLSDLLALDVALPIPVKGSEGISFSSPNPNYQPEPIAKGAEIVTSGVYTHPLAADFLQLQFMKHSKLGPCDTLLLTDGSFDSAGNRIGGSYLLAFEGRELSNRFISVPGNKVVWRNIAKRCENEFKGFYAEDVTSLGFRVVNVQAQKFKLKASKSSNGFYRFQVLDDGGAATYILFIEQPGEKEIIFSGRDALLNLKSDLPVRIKMQRNDGVEISLTDSLSHLINLTANNN